MSKLPEPSAEEIDGPSEEEVLGAQMSENETPFDGNDLEAVEMYLPTEEEERRAQAAEGDGPFPENDQLAVIPADFPLSWTELTMRDRSGELVIPIYCSGRTQSRQIVENGMQLELLIKMPQEDVKYIIDRIENPGPETYQIYYKGGTEPIGTETVYYDSMVGVAQWGGQYYVADEFKQKFSNVRVEKCN